MYLYKTEDFFGQNDTIVMTESEFVPCSLMDHSHEYLEIAYICEGVGEHMLNGKRHTVKRGDVFFIARGSVHNYNGLSADFRWINCLFLPQALSPDAFNCDNARDILTLTVFSDIGEFAKFNAENIELRPNQDTFRNIFMDMLEEYKKNAAGAQEVLRHYLAVLWVKLFREYAGQDGTQKKSSGQDYSQLVFDYLEKNSFENFSIEEVAKKAFLSPRYFQTVFKKNTGKSLTQFLHEVRVRKACEMMEETDLAVNEIMREVGYNDTKFFYEIFKRYTGITPGAYKQNFKK